MTAATVTGRMTPRPTGPVRHDVRFWGKPGGDLRAACEPCQWSVHLEGGRDAADLARLAAMHDGTAT